jgi:undecaprenyl-diphosphatase
MELIKSIILGLVQGLSEFLPISSSGHLVLTKHFLNFYDENAAFEIMVHFGTLVSVLIYFRKDIWELLTDGLKNLPKFVKYAFLGLKRNVDKEDLYAPYYLWFIVISMIPAGYVGLVYKDQILELFNNVTVVLMSLAVTGIVMILSRFFKETEKSFGIFSAFIVGIAQAFAILPGISRSGSTIVTGMVMGFKREFVAKFSFLMSLPVIAGAFLLKLDELFVARLSFDQWLNYGTGTVVAAISGYFAIGLVMDFVKKGKLEYFGYYCLIVAGFGFLLI